MTATSWLKFYPSDWRGDAGLRGCTFAARGLWIDLICIMHEATPYGHLLIHGKPPSYYRIAQVIGADRKQVKRMMLQLKNRGVFSVNSRGEIYSRRMVRDHAKSQQGREFIKRRWGGTPITPDTRKKERGPTKENRGKKNGEATAQHRWESDLRRTLRFEDYARAVELLAADPDLVERATKAELRKPGSGALAAMLGLSVREVGA